MSRKMDYSKIRRKPVEFDTNRAEQAFKNTDVVMIYTDGSCLQNPGGKGGWAAIVKGKNGVQEMFGCEPETTNNRQELLGPIMALESLPWRCSVILATDSQYVVQGATKWIAGWKRRGWKTQAGEAVKNRDLWERLDALCQNHSISWHWVRGHNGHVENERCDILAGIAARDQVSS